ncbi:MAG: P-type conjugative transfer protein TrbL, partial [Pseudomonadota bacterium]|nr:P-type conjugative transfer protein TrbL [Pseudomonadota bacterium]
ARARISGSAGAGKSSQGQTGSAGDAQSSGGRADVPPSAHQDTAPAWAQSLRAEQTSRHRRQLAIHALQQGDRGSGSATPDISERSE